MERICFIWPRWFGTASLDDAELGIYTAAPLRFLIVDAQLADDIVC